MYYVLCVTTEWAMRNLQVIGKAVVDVYDNMFTLLAMNLIWALLAALPFSSMVSILQTALETPELGSTAWVMLVVFALLFVLLTGPATYALAVMMRRVTDYESISVRDFFAAMRAH